MGSTGHVLRGVKKAAAVVLVRDRDETEGLGLKERRVW